MVNIKELLGNNNQLQNLLLDTVEEGEVYRLCLTKEEGVVGAPVKSCVYNLGLWREFRIFALTKQY